jgi:hypothetical protein
MATMRWSLSHGLWTTGSPAFSNHVADASNDAIGVAIQARDAEAITHIGFRYGARTGTPPVYVATLEGLSGATGFPDGTDVGGGSPTAKTFTPPADATWDGTWQWIQLTNAYTPSRGQMLCPTIRYSSGTIDGSNNGSFTTHATSLNQGTFFQFPKALRLTAGTWAGQAAFPILALRTASTRYLWPIESFYSTRSASTVGHRQAVKFTLPAGSGDTFKVRGARFLGSLSSAAAKTPVFGLWNAGGVLQSIALDTEWSAFASTAYVVYEFLFDEASLSSLSFGTAYYLGLEVADAANGGVILNGIQLDSADDQDAYSGGASVGFATFDGSTWTDDATVRPFVELLLEDITEPAAGGGAVLAPGNVSGGIFQ